MIAQWPGILQEGPPALSMEEPDRVLIHTKSILSVEKGQQSIQKTRPD